ncbi:MAG: hypothetical protein PHY60_08290 [Atopobiaceae bacterium]|nr:hypothetical protein [Atopobiaceae bacterium]
MGPYECAHTRRRARRTAGICSVAVLLLAAVMLVLPGCGGSASGGTTANTASLSDDEIADLYNGSTSYKGRTITVSGKVFNVDGSDGFQLWHDPANNAGNTLVKGTGCASGLASGDYVIVTGTVDDPYTGTNAVGGSVTAVSIAETSVEKSSYKDVMAPTLKEVAVGQTVDQGGCQVTLDKIEFAANETRVYVTATNNGTAQFTPYGYSAHLIQGGKQIEVDQTNSYQQGYDQLSYTGIVSGASSSGVIVFPAVDQASLQFVIGGYCSDYTNQLGDFTFDVTI